MQWNAHQKTNGHRGAYRGVPGHVEEDPGSKEGCRHCVCLRCQRLTHQLVILDQIYLNRMSHRNL